MFKSKKQDDNHDKKPNNQTVPAGLCPIESVKILGSGCANCNQLEKATQEALDELNIPVKIDHVQDFTDIAAYGVMSTPALVVNEQVLSFGKVLKKKDVLKLLQQG